MVVRNRIGKVAFLSTYPPRECGLATFTQDLVSEIDRAGLLHRPQVIAVSDTRYNYDEPVVMELQQHERNNYRDIAREINRSGLELLVIQHEYGIFGGECGEYLLDLIDALQVPLITTVHTVLPNPLPKQREILKTLGARSQKIVTMARNTVDLLKKVYEIQPDKIEVIHHGVPFRVMESREKLKEKYGMQGRQVISTFGLISPGKGLEYGIEAVARVAREHKDVLYLILGQTHPCVKREYGEAYRERLLDLVERLGVRDHVQFVNKYLTKEEIIQYLQLSDIYMTPYLGKDQAVSGTLAYAVGYGRVIIATPYSYAREMLADGRGLLAEFADADSLAKCIKFVLENPDKKKEMEQKTLSIGKTMMWGNIANQYTRLFLNIIEKSQKAGVAV